VTQGIFINYRGEDSDLCGVLIYRALVERFGSDDVFLASNSIQAGDDFAAAILDRLRSVSVLLAIIGPRWLTAADGSGRRRIDSPDDWVRRELREAFARGLRVIPVLTDGATMPPESALPDEIAELSRRQFVRVRRRHVEEDLAQLVARLTAVEPSLSPDNTDAAQKTQELTRSVPAQLPSDVVAFTGRSAELSELDDLIDDNIAEPTAAVIGVVSGTAGVGKPNPGNSHTCYVRCPCGPVRLRPGGGSETPKGCPLRLPVCRQPTLVLARCGPPVKGRRYISPFTGGPQRARALPGLTVGGKAVPNPPRAALAAIPEPEAPAGGVCVCS